GGPGGRGGVMAVGDVVQGAAGATHRDSTEREQRQQHRVRPTGRRERYSPPAWEQQQPSTDRPVKAGETGVRPDSRRQPAFDPIALTDVARLGAGGWPPVEVPEGFHPGGSNFYLAEATDEAHRNGQKPGAAPLFGGPAHTGRGSRARHRADALFALGAPALSRCDGRWIQRRGRGVAVPYRRDRQEPGAANGGAPIAVTRTRARPLAAVRAD